MYLNLLTKRSPYRAYFPLLDAKLLTHVMGYFGAHNIACIKNLLSNKIYSQRFRFSLQLQTMHCGVGENLAADRT